MASRKIVRTAVMAAAAMALFGAGTAAAQQYPSKNITLVVGFSAGGVADTVARLIGQKLSKSLGQNVVVENRGGAAGNIAAKLVTEAAPDGYTVLVTTTAIAVNETLHKNRGFKVADLKTLAIVASSPEALATSVKNPANSLSELVKASKDKPVTFGTAGIGSGSHVAAEYFFKVLAKTPATHVPFKGGAPAINDAVAGHIDMISATLGGGLVNQIRGGKLKGLAVASDKRVAVLPNVPTLAESGYPAFSAASWVGFFVPAKTDAAVAAKLSAAIEAAVKEADVDQRLKALGFDPIHGTQAQAETMFKAEVDRWGKMVTTLGLSIQ